MAVEKEADGRLRVRFSTGDSDVFDTVLSARGRYPDLTALNAGGIGLATDGASGKLLCRHEQTSVPHVYAVGDVVQGTPELTPVAIQAGVLLARRYACVCVWFWAFLHLILRTTPTPLQRRLFGGAAEQMDYWRVATTVFTPLEYGCVGLSEEQAMDELGADGFEVRFGPSVGRSLFPVSPPSLLPTHQIHPPPRHPTGVPLRVPAPRVGPRARAAGGQRLLQGAGGQARRPCARAALLRPQRGGGHPGLRSGYEGVRCGWRCVGGGWRT